MGEALTNNQLAGHTACTTKSLRGLRPVSHADIFLPAHSRYVAYYGQDERPIYLNKARRRNAVVESCPPSYRWATTKHYGGHMSTLSIATSVAPVIDIPSKPQFEAVITSEQIDTIGKTLAEHNRTRRLMLLFLSFDSETFMEKAKAVIDGDEDIYMEAIEALDDYQKKLKSLSELANSALARFLWVGEYLSQEGE